MLLPREQAALVWLGILVAGLLLWMLFDKDIRSSVAGVLRAATAPKLLAAFIAFYVYSAAWIVLAHQVGLWDRGLIKETVVWGVIAGFAVLAAGDKADDDPRYFRRALASAFGFNVLIAVLFGIASFSFWVEFALLPCIALLGFIEIVALSKRETEPVGRAAGWLIAASGFVVFFGTLWHVWQDRDQIDWSLQGYTLALLVWLPLTALPFIYVLSWLMNYEKVAMRLRFRRDPQRVPPWMHMALVVGINGHLHHLGRLQGQDLFHIAESSSFRAALSAVRDARARMDDEDVEESAAATRLVTMATVEGYDGEGNSFDQREIKETQRALRWVATCHAGRYQNRGRYQSDLLEAVLTDFENQGLPTPHGIHMWVSPDGQRWYAWRRTVGGCVLAIGAASGPPDEWLYEGVEPPEGFPGEDEVWGDAPFVDTPPNWR